MLMDLLLMVAVIAECVEDLSQAQMRQPCRDGLRCQTLPPSLHDRPDWRAGTLDNWPTAKDLIIGDDVAMGRCLKHGDASSALPTVLGDIRLSAVANKGTLLEEAAGS